MSDKKYTHRIVIQGNELFGNKEDVSNMEITTNTCGKYKLLEKNGSQFGMLSVKSGGSYMLSLKKTSGAFNIRLSRQDVEIIELVE